MNTLNSALKASGGYVQKCTECGWLVGPVGQTLCQACWIEQAKLLRESVEITQTEGIEMIINTTDSNAFDALAEAFRASVEADTAELLCDDGGLRLYLTWADGSADTACWSESLGRFAYKQEGSYASVLY